MMIAFGLVLFLGLISGVYLVALFNANDDDWKGDIWQLDTTTMD